MILVTGSLGLVGSEAVRYFLDKGEEVIGIDNNMRKTFFGKDGDVSWNQIVHDNYTFYPKDIRDCGDIIKKCHPDMVIHCAGQPSHDWAMTNPIMDFSVNAKGTLCLLEAFRKNTPDGVFIYVSTNKVYGDRPNRIGLMEDNKRFTPYDLRFINGINESMSVDNCMHSLFGVSKLSGDLLTQEYGKYFNLKTGVFRCGCITGSAQSPVELHGFLAYVARCSKENKVFKIYGYQGKQVRDIIHAYDLVTAFDAFYHNPKQGEVYNMGGGFHSNISVLEALETFEVCSEYTDTPRKGDHKWYISDCRKFKKDYPMWSYKYSLKDIIEELKGKVC